MNEEVAIEYSAETKKLGDKIVELTLKQAKQLSDYLENEHGIKPAAGGGVIMQAGPDGGGAGPEPEQTEFDVVLEGFGDKKISVIKEVRALKPGIALTEAKQLVEGIPGKILEGVSKEDAEKAKSKLEGAGGTVSIK